jgi:hypothetical protein
MGHARRITPFLAVLALLGAVAGCGAPPTGQVSGRLVAQYPVRSTLHGTLNLSVTGRVELISSSGATYFTRTTNSDLFKLTVPPGRYIARSVSTSRGPCQAQPTHVRVRAGANGMILVFCTLKTLGGK